MTLPSLFPPSGLGRIEFQRSDLIKPFLRYSEPGTWWNGTRGDLLSGCFPAVKQILDYELTGADPSTGEWTITVTPITTRMGAAAAAAQGPASISFTAAATTLANTVLGLINAAKEGSELLTADDLASWTRFLSYVTLSVSPTGATHLRISSVAGGQEFSVQITAPVGNGSTLTTIASPSATTLKVGLYCAIDRSQGSNGYNQIGQPYLKVIEASTPAADIVGPIYLGDGVEPLETGAPYKEFVQSKDVPLTRYGNVLAYVETTIPATSIDSPVYVRHTADAAGHLPGMATDAAGAAAGATANLWTGSITAADTTLYQVQIQVQANDGEIVSETIAFTSGAGATTTTIANGLRANLLTKSNLTGLVTGSGTTTLILTGPADGRAVTVTNVGPGVIAFVETTPEVSTHKLLTRGDRFLAESSHVSGPVDVPHSNA